MSMRVRRLPLAVVAAGLLVLILAGSVLAGRGTGAAGQRDDQAEQLLAQGQRAFRFDTFGDEAFWGGTLGLHRAIEGARLGGVGPGVSPKTALAVGLKVDSDALPPQVITGIKTGKVDLNDPATTLALFKLNAVVGVTGFFSADGQQLRSVGIQCALCHSTVDNAVAPGIGHRLDGWANRDLNVGAIIFSAWTTRRRGRCWRAGVRVNSTPNFSSMGRHSTQPPGRARRR